MPTFDNARITSVVNSDGNPEIAAIARHDGAFAAFEDTCRAYEAVRDAAGQGGRALTPDDEAAYDAASEAEAEALAAVGSSATTPQGLRAAVEHYLGTDCLDPVGFLEAILKAPLFA